MRLKTLISKADRKAANSQRPYVIAEAGVNHEGNMELAKRMIEEAKEGGADAIKFQTYKADTIAVKKSPAYWDLNAEPTTSQYALFKKYDKFWKKEFEQLRKICETLGIEFLSTPFDAESAEFLNDLMDVFKISSSDITNKPFIEFLCGFRKPILLSTGASYLHEIVEAVEWIDSMGNPLGLLHCVLNYPTLDENVNLLKIRTLREKFPQYVIGYSDHTLPKEMKTLETAWLLGAEILEKHFTFDKTLPGNDHYHAMDKVDMIKFMKRIKRASVLLGSSDYRDISKQAPARWNARRSLVAVKTIPKGSTITRESLTWKRPAHGVSPRQIEAVIGKIALKDIVEDDIITWQLIQ